MTPDDWDILSECIIQGKCALVLGPEVPFDAPKEVGVKGIKGTCASALRDHLRSELIRWKNLTEEQAKELPTTLAAIAQIYEDIGSNSGDMSLKSKAGDFYRQNKLKPSEAHTKIADLPFSVILSACHDDLLIEAMGKLKHRKRPQPYYYKLGEINTETPIFDKISVKSPLIYHFFGHYINNRQLILSENNLLDFLIKAYSGEPKLLDEVVIKLNKCNSLLFIGFDIEDWYLRIILKALVRFLDKDGNKKTGYALEPYRCVVKREYNPTVLFYGRGTPIRICDELDLLSFIEKLNDNLAEKGWSIDNTRNVGPKVFISHASEDEELARYICEYLKKDIFRPWIDAELRGGEIHQEIIAQKIQESDFVVALATPNLTEKILNDTGSYVGQEISLANKRVNTPECPFLIPLLANGQVVDNLIRPLKDKTVRYLRKDCRDDDLAALADYLWEKYPGNRTKL